MMLDTVLGLLAGVIILGILIGQHVVSSDAAALQLTAVIVTNTIYEAFLMFLLGYGLFEFPRRFWLDSDVRNRLERVYIKASSDFKDISDAHINISQEVANALKTKEELASNRDPEIQRAMQIIMDECPPEFRSARAGTVAMDKDAGRVTLASLSALRTELKFHKSRYRMAEAKVESTKLLAYFLEDIVDALDRNDNKHQKYDGVQRINWSLTDKASTESEYNWYIFYHPMIWKCLCALFTAISVFSFLGVVCSINGVPVGNSVYFLAVQGPTASIGGIVFFIFCTLGYTTYITMWALFQMKFAGLMDLVPARTTPESLSFNVRMVARLAAPLSFFYLGWIAENGLNQGSWTYNEGSNGDTIYMPSAFSRFYQLQSVGFIKSTFGIIFPVMLMVFVVLFGTNLYNFVCVRLNFQSWQFGTPIITDEQKRVGMQQLGKTKRSTLNKARRSRFRLFLTGGTKAGEDDEDPDQGGRTIFSALWPWGKADDEVDLVTDTKSSALIGGGRKDNIQVKQLEMPSIIKGRVTKKTGMFGSSTDWYVEIKPPGILTYFKSLEDAEQEHPSETEEALDLLDIVDFVLSGSELRLNLHSDSTRLKFKDSNEAEHWKRGMQEWKDFAFEHSADYYKNLADELDSINVGDVEAGNSAQSGRSPVVTTDTGKGTVSPSAFATNSKTKSTSHVDDIPTLSMGDEKPSAFADDIDMKVSKSLMGADFEKRYLKIDEASMALQVFKAGSDTTPVVSIHFSNIEDVSFYKKGSTTDFSRFNVKTVSDEVHKFRAKNDAKGKEWEQRICEWRDYALMNMLH
jgi:hypothetical protein